MVNTIPLDQWLIVHSERQTIYSVWVHVVPVQVYC